MHGFSIALPSLLGGKASFSRSASSPTLSNISRPQFNDKSSNTTRNELPRSASFSLLPNFDWNLDAEEEATLGSSTQLLEITDNKPTDIELEQNYPIQNEKQRHKRQSLVTGPKFWKKKAKGQLEVQQTAIEVASSRSLSSNSSNTLPRSEREILPRSLSAPLATIARKSWIPPKTMHKTTESKNLAEMKKICDPMTEELEKPTDTTVNYSSKYSLDPLQELPKMTFHKLFESSCSTLISSSTLESTNSSIISLNESFIDNQSTPRTSMDKVQALPDDISSKKNGHISIEGYGKRDELYSVFRALENDFNKFQSKSWALKMNVVRSSIVPFLRSYSESTLLKNLRPEDLERRVIVLNKWWTGLLEMLDGKHSQTISGLDRPILLQGCFDIMIRPEWRYSLSVPIHSENEKVPSRSASRRILLPKIGSATPACSTNLPFIIESVNQNIHKLFIHNLSLQVNFAVEKMSLRCAPASLVAFCGKAVAYAFFFVPGIAEILVRIWRLQPDILRRVSDELEIPRRDGKLELDDIIASFPSHLHCLTWNSVKSMSNFLRKSPNIPAMFEKTVWYGPWVARWCGRDSDLFFIFVKNYLIICESLFPPDFTLRERARAPGYLLVLAQTLIAIDGTIHRQPSSDPLPISFDDVLAGADASATALPLPSNNSIRIMAENRSITLLRDFLYERPSENEKARITFGQLFEKMMQAAAKKTSIFDHNACFILCDFMEEALNIYVHFQEASKFIDWRFWLDVCQKILESENTMSEIRLFALIYCVWDIITADDRRKEVLCLDWLLTEKFFDKYFNHWCPMIRAYYMRLLCWRVCRNNGESSDLDIKIFHTVFIRVRSNWEYHLHMKFQAETNNSSLPSTSPCLPAPGRRLLIIRNDNPLPTAPLYIGFDGFVSRGSCRNLAQISSFHRNSSPSPISTPDSNSSTELTVEPSKNNLTSDIHFSRVTSIKKRWTLLGKTFLFPFFDSNSSTCSDELTESPLKTRSMSDDDGNSQPLEDCKSITPIRSHLSTDSVANEKASEVTMVYRASSFRFSLEFAVQFENGTSSSFGSGNFVTNGTHIGSSGITTSVQGLGERQLSPPRIPAPAQALLAAKVSGVCREINPKDGSLTGNYDNIAPRTLASDTSEKRSFAHDETSFQSKTRGKFNSGIKKGNFIASSIYKGRALAEWAIVVGECNGFLERRRNEGVPNLKLVEVPMLGVEGFRRNG
ncbi:putative protein family upf0592 protein [Erysiphe neolycopersici]|uniref:DUF1765-domain-containing protein n=1 Tax=Erysiphe neolycopersici TaxID=212602 RepID=A0A420HQ73_9PEZI|nr:putative protein family upf0592 protein [Erysiphe neolycopersici]